MEAAYYKRKRLPRPRREESAVELMGPFHFGLAPAAIEKLAVLVAVIPLFHRLLQLTGLAPDGGAVIVVGRNLFLAVHAQDGGVADMSFTDIPVAGVAPDRFAVNVDASRFATALRTENGQPADLGDGQEIATGRTGLVLIGSTNVGATDVAAMGIVADMRLGLGLVAFFAMPDDLVAVSLADFPSAPVAGIGHAVNVARENPHGATQKEGRERKWKQKCKRKEKEGLHPLRKTDSQGGGHFHLSRRGGLQGLPVQYRP